MSGSCNNIIISWIKSGPNQFHHTATSVFLNLIFRKVKLRKGNKGRIISISEKGGRARCGFFCVDWWNKDLNLEKTLDKKNSGQGKKTKLPVSSYFHLYGWGVILS